MTLLMKKDFYIKKLNSIGLFKCKPVYNRII